jgi:hypothetical protein
LCSAAYVQIYCAEVHPNQIINVENMDRNVFTALSRVWLIEPISMKLALSSQLFEKKGTLNLIKI